MTGFVWTVVSLSVLALIALAVWILVLLAQRRSKAKGGFPVLPVRGPKQPTATPPVGVPAGGVWVVFNPSKMSDVPAFKNEVERRVVAETGLVPHWLETTREDPGTGQAVRALGNDPSLVIAAGGDGTLRAVAAGMAHSGVPLGLLPIGTGNLLARNLGLPLETDHALDVALAPAGRPMDLGWLRMENVAESAGLPPEGFLLNEARGNSAPPADTDVPAVDEYAFLVIAGVGFDGEAIASTKPELKKWVGWPAYVLTALKSLHIERMKANVTVSYPQGSDPFGQGPTPTTKKLRTRLREKISRTHTLGAPGGLSDVVDRTATYDTTAVQARSVLFANCGELPFALLAPDATLDDGQLDLIAIDTRGGVFGWAFLSAKVLSHTVGMRAINAKNDPAKIQFRQTPLARVDISKPYPVQVDGDALGTASSVVARVDHHALWVRVPSGSSVSVRSETTEQAD